MTQDISDLNLIIYYKLNEEKIKLINTVTIYYLVFLFILILYILYLYQPLVYGRDFPIVVYGRV
jgi:hypothetical protein